MTCAIWCNLDDTLTELTREYEDIYTEACEEAGLDALTDQYETYTKRFFNYFKKNYAFPRHQAIDTLVKDEDDYDPDSAERFTEAWDRLEAEATAVKAGVLETLEELAEDHPLGIITNGTGALQRRKLELTGIGDHIDEIVVSAEEGVMKPDKKLFLAARNRIDCDTAVIVSHLPKRDIVAGKQAGFDAVWLTASDRQIPEEVAEQVGHIEELPAAIERLCG